LSLDLALLAVLAAAGVQLVPMPEPMRLLISPSIADYQQRALLSLPASAAWRPLSLRPQDWVFGAGLFAAAAGMFWLSREAAQSHGGRLLVRWIAWTSFAASLLAIVSPALYPANMIYGFWKPVSHMAHTAGPFVSRNHFAAWLVLAAPLTAGYLASHIRTHWIGRSGRARILGDMRALWLVAAGAVMTAALFVTASRSGTIGFAVAATFGLARGWRGLGAKGRVALLSYVALLVIAAIAWANPDIVMHRFDQALGADAWGGRPVIWQETRKLIALFWPVGIGLAAYEFIMPIYQTATHEVLFNHAHSQYLQLVAEGGVLVTVPVCLALVAFLRLAFRRLSQDTSPFVHIREGALAGMLGLAVQSIWETPLITPAVFFLLAACGGLAVRGSDSGEAAS
jgi:O-antigen ligase